MKYEINENSIKEINEEIDEIIDHLTELYETRKYLTRQLELMKESMKVAFFPGKFHPPHIGQIQTIFRILNKYKKIILCVSGHMPDDPVTTPYKIYCLLKSFFKDYDNIEVIFLDEILINKTNLDGLPQFDVLLSGNEAVLNWAKSYNIECEFCERSEGFLLVGTDIREILNKEGEK